MYHNSTKVIQQVGQAAPACPPKHTGIPCLIGHQLPVSVSLPHQRHERSPRIVGPFDGIKPTKLYDFLLKALQELFFWRLQELPLVKQIVSSDFYREHGPRYYLNVTSIEHINIALRPVFEDLVDECKEKDRVALLSSLESLKQNLSLNKDPHLILEHCKTISSHFEKRCCASHPQLLDLLLLIVDCYEGDCGGIAGFINENALKLIDKQITQLQNPNYKVRMNLPRDIFIDALREKGWQCLADRLIKQRVGLSKLEQKLAKIQETYLNKILALVALPGALELGASTPVLTGHFENPKQQPLSDNLLTYFTQNAPKDFAALPKIAKQIRTIIASQKKESERPKDYVDELLRLINESLNLADEAAKICMSNQAGISPLDVLQRACFLPTSLAKGAQIARDKQGLFLKGGDQLRITVVAWNEMIDMLASPSNTDRMKAYKIDLHAPPPDIKFPYGDGLLDGKSPRLNGVDADLTVLYNALWRRYEPVRTGGCTHARVYDPSKADVEIALHHPLFRTDAEVKPKVSVMKGHGRTYVALTGHDQEPPAPVYIPGTTVEASRERKIDNEQPFTVYMVSCLGGRGIWDGSLERTDNGDQVPDSQFSLANHNWDLPPGTRISKVKTYRFPHPNEVESMALFFDWFDWLAQKKASGMQQIHVKLHLPGLDYMVEAMYAYFNDKITKDACFEYLESVHDRFAHIKHRLKNDATDKGLGFSVGTPYDTIQRVFLNADDGLRSIDDIIKVFKHLMDKQNPNLEPDDSLEEKYCSALAALLGDPTALDCLKQHEEFKHLTDLKAINPGSEKTVSWKRFDRARGSRFKALLDHGNVVAVLQSGIAQFSRNYKKRKHPISILYPASEIPQIHEAERLAQEERKTQLRAAEAKVKSAEEVLSKANETAQALKDKGLDVDLAPILAPACQVLEEATNMRDQLLQQAEETVGGYATLYLSPLSTDTGVNTYQVDYPMGVQREMCELLVEHCVSTAYSPTIRDNPLLEMNPEHSEQRSRYKQITDKIFGPSQQEPDFAASASAGVDPSSSDDACSDDGLPDATPTRQSNPINECIRFFNDKLSSSRSDRSESGSEAESGVGSSEASACSVRGRASTWPAHALTRSLSFDSLLLPCWKSRTPPVPVPSVASGVSQHNADRPGLNPSSI